ncbi:acetyl-CoA synthetase-like protein [Hymenopellis radicata]|nr:acetyl-CoA synthetase-like protein [Hymenopellis radicata]
MFSTGFITSVLPSSPIALRRPPSPPDLNAYHIFFDRPDQQQSPWTDKDFTLYIDLKTEKKISYRTFKADVASARSALTSAGIKQGELVGIMSENCIEFALLVHTLMSLNVPFALIAPYSTPFELAHAVKLTGVKKVFVGPKQAKLGWTADTELFVLNGRVEGLKCVAEMVQAAGNAPPKTDLAYLVFSSGTSGLPKAVMITHGNVIFSVSQVAVMMRAVLAVAVPPPPETPEGIPITLAFLPMHHSYGLHSYCFRAFLSPSTSVLQGHWNMQDALRGIMKYKITNINLIPSVIAQLVAHPSPALVKESLKTLRYLGSGAAYLPPELAARLRELISTGLRIGEGREGYGMSEATIAAVTQPIAGTLGKLKVIEGSCGVLLPGMEAKILDESGRSVKVGEVGELWLKSENISPGYYGSSPEVVTANRETFVDGWLRTGDRFYVDEDENFFFADRAKDTLKISGIQVSPLELENVLLAHPEKLITDVAVAGVGGYGRTNDERVPRAWVVLSERGKDFGTQQVARELIKWCEAQVSKYKWLRGGVEIVDEIPKSPTGKTLRRLLVVRHEESMKSGDQERAKL